MAAQTPPPTDTDAETCFEVYGSPGSDSGWGFADYITEPVLMVDRCDGRSWYLDWPNGSAPTWRPIGVAQ